MQKIVAALLAVVVVGLGEAGMVEAMSVNPGQLGDALIFPLFDVNNLNTLIAIENFDRGRTIVYRVRFREEVSGNTVLSFDLCLFPTATWTAAVFRDGSVTRVVSESTLLVNGSSTPLDTVLSPDAARGFIEVVALRGSFTEIAVCTDATLGGDASNDTMGKAYFVNPAQSPLLAYGMNALALKDFATVKIDDGTVLGNNDVATALLSRSTDDRPSFRSSVFGSRYFVDPAFGAETRVVMTFPTGPRSSACSNCLVPGSVRFFPFREDGSPLVGPTVDTGSHLVNVFTLTSSDIASPSGLFRVFDCFFLTHCPNIPVTGFVVQTTSTPPPGQPFFNALFPLAIQ